MLFRARNVLTGVLFSQKKVPTIEKVDTHCSSYPLLRVSIKHINYLVQTSVDTIHLYLVHFCKVRFKRFGKVVQYAKNKP